LEPKKSFQQLVGEENLPDTFTTRVKNYHSSGRSLFVLHLALAEPPKYLAGADNPAVDSSFSQEMFGATTGQQ
jgi:hypothetical protein